MKITKYPQSCILLETRGKKILIDPGQLKWEDSFLEDWKGSEIILVTHKHADHCYAEAIAWLMKRSKTKLYTSREVADAYPDLTPRVVQVGDVIEERPLKIEVVKAVHGFIPLLKGSKEIRENLGFIVDDGEKRAYATGDSICFDNERRCDIIFVPVCNHGLVMGPFEAALFAQAAGAKMAIPIHYDNPSYPTDLEKVEQVFKKQGVSYQILNVRESLEF